MKIVEWIFFFMFSRFIGWRERNALCFWRVYYQVYTSHIFNHGTQRNHHALPFVLYKYRRHNSTHSFQNNRVIFNFFCTVGRYNSYWIFPQRFELRFAWMRVCTLLHDVGLAKALVQYDVGEGFEIPNYSIMNTSRNTLSRALGHQ